MPGSKMLAVTSVENINNEIITAQHCTEPTIKIRKIYGLLHHKHVSFTRKKSVVLPAEINKTKQLIAKGIRSDSCNAD